MVIQEKRKQATLDPWIYEIYSLGTLKDDQVPLPLKYAPSHCPPPISEVQFYYIVSWGRRWRGFRVATVPLFSLELCWMQLEGPSIYSPWAHMSFEPSANCYI